MSVRNRWLALALSAAASVWGLWGCGPAATTSPPPAPKPDAPKAMDHKDMDHKDGDPKDKDNKETAHKDKDHEEHEGAALTEKDVKMPGSFKEGVGRLEELDKKIRDEIGVGEEGLKHVHRIAEEMALVAKKMKELAAKEVAEDKQTEAGRLCNEIAGYYKPIDEAADAGKKPETEAIEKKMADAVGKLKALQK